MLQFQSIKILAENNYGEILADGTKIAEQLVMEAGITLLDWA